MFSHKTSSFVPYRLHCLTAFHKGTTRSGMDEERDKMSDLMHCGYQAASVDCGRVIYPSVPLPNCITPTHGTTFHRNAYVALKSLKLPVMSVNRYFCDAE